jgi:hypothetical protein
MNLLVRVLYILFAIACVVLAYYVIVWVLKLLGIMPPDPIMTVIFVILGLAAAIGALTGRFDWPKNQ